MTEIVLLCRSQKLSHYHWFYVRSYKEKTFQKNKNIRQNECTHRNVNTTNYIDDDDCVVPNNKNALYIYGCFLQLRKLLQVSYCNCCYWTWLRFTTVYNLRSMSNGQNHLQRPSRNRARLCLLCSRLDWLPLGFRGCEQTYFLWN